MNNTFLETNNFLLDMHQTIRRPRMNKKKKKKKKNENFHVKNSDIFHISAQNIDCGYSLEPPHRGGSNEYPNLCFEQK